MLLVKTKIAASHIHGIGLFAGQFIPKGTATWEFCPEFDAAFSADAILTMNEHAHRTFLHYSYFDKLLMKHVLCFDDQRFINHSSLRFNIKSTPRVDIAARDIYESEEMLCDYNLFDDTYFDRLKINVDNLR